MQVLIHSHDCTCMCAETGQGPVPFSMVLHIISYFSNILLIIWDTVTFSIIITPIPLFNTSRIHLHFHTPQLYVLFWSSLQLQFVLPIYSWAYDKPSMVNPSGATSKKKTDSFPRSHQLSVVSEVTLWARIFTGLYVYMLHLWVELSCPVHSTLFFPSPWTLFLRLFL